MLEENEYRPDLLDTKYRQIDGLTEKQRVIYACINGASDEQLGRVFTRAETLYTEMIRQENSDDITTQEKKTMQPDNVVSLHPKLPNQKRK